MRGGVSGGSKIIEIKNMGNGSQYNEGGGVPVNPPLSFDINDINAACV